MMQWIAAIRAAAEEVPPGRYMSMSPLQALALCDLAESWVQHEAAEIGVLACIGCGAERQDLNPNDLCEECAARDD